jgi:hypothetical protein
LDCADRAPGHRQGPYILAPGPGSGGRNRPPRRQADPGGPIIAARCPERTTQPPFSACGWKERNGPEKISVSWTEFSILYVWWASRPRGASSAAPDGWLMRRAVAAAVAASSGCWGPTSGRADAAATRTFDRAAPAHHVGTSDAHATTSDENVAHRCCSGSTSTRCSCVRRGCWWGAVLRPWRALLDRSQHSDDR